MKPYTIDLTINVTHLYIIGIILTFWTAIQGSYIRQGGQITFRLIALHFAASLFWPLAWLLVVLSLWHSERQFDRMKKNIKTSVKCSTSE